MRLLLVPVDLRSSVQVLDESQLQSTRAYQAERAASAKTDLAMLDDSLDPLVIGAGAAARAMAPRDPLSPAPRAVATAPEPGPKVLKG